MILYNCCRRLESSIHYRNSSSSPSTACRIYLLQSPNIYRNLAFEAALCGDLHAANSSSRSALLLWCSAASVVIGRFQLAWREANVKLLRDNNWPLARRQSGGGTVYHDAGNLNISFIQPRPRLDRQACMTFLANVGSDLLVGSNWKVTVGQRYDLWLCRRADNNEHPRIHFIPMHTQPTVQTRATDSFRSRVANIDLPVNLVHDAIVETAKQWLVKLHPSTSSPVDVIRVHEGQETEFVSDDRFQRELASLQSWQWIYGASPPFSLKLSHLDGDKEDDVVSPDEDLKLTVGKGGLISSLELTGGISTSSRANRFVTHLSTLLEGMQCCPVNVKTALEHSLYRLDSTDCDSCELNRLVALVNKLINAI